MFRRHSQVWLTFGRKAKPGKLPSPHRGRGAGVRGVLADHPNPLTPNPSPPMGRGEDGPTLIQTSSSGLSLVFRP
jgi:hypothetical protein